MRKPRLLDLFCGAGGASMGYYRAGFEVVGVDIAPQKHYPFEFHQADALTYPLEGFDAIHASPPCQFISEATPVAHRARHQNLIGPIRDRLRADGAPYVIENVENARRFLESPTMLCGTMFGLPIWRHRYFETWPAALRLTPPCQHRFGFSEEMINGYLRRIQLPVLCTGGGDGKRSARKTHRPRGNVDEIRFAMQIPWMTQIELSQAVPPAYTEWLGHQLFDVVINQMEAA